MSRNACLSGKTIEKYKEVITIDARIVVILEGEERTVTGMGK